MPNRRSRTLLPTTKTDDAASAAGVARPSTHGHAMISTARAALNACCPVLPAASQPARVSMASTRMAGTNTPAIRSASRWIAAF
jgi:hypothetical protein